jgi:hypothetical protein
MGILSSLFETIGGNWIRVAALPVAFVAALTGWHQFRKASDDLAQVRETRLIERGRQQCISAIELEAARFEAFAAKQRAQAAVAESEDAQRISVEIQANAETLKADLDRVRSTVASDAGRCLSDSVLELVRDDQRGKQKAR